MMTPLQINMMLHYYAIAEPYAKYDPSHANSSAVVRQRLQLIHRGMLGIDDRQGSGFYPTPIGLAYVARLQAMPIEAQDDLIPLCPFCNIPHRTNTKS